MQICLSTMVNVHLTVNYHLLTVVFLMINSKVKYTIATEQWFSTGVPRNPRVPPEVIKMLGSTVYVNSPVQICEQGSSSH